MGCPYLLFFNLSIWSFIFLFKFSSKLSSLSRFGNVPDGLFVKKGLFCFFSLIASSPILYFFIYNMYQSGWFSCGFANQLCIKERLIIWSISISNTGSFSDSTERTTGNTLSRYGIITVGSLIKTIVLSYRWSKKQG